MISKLLSGAQTGADHAALDWAIFRDIPHGGWSRWIISAFGHMVTAFVAH